MRRQCCCKTKRGKPCPFNADRLRDNRWYCHIHDPIGKYRQNVRLKRKGHDIRRLNAEDEHESLDREYDAIVGVRPVFDPDRALGAERTT